MKNLMTVTQTKPGTYRIAVTDTGAQVFRVRGRAAQKAFIRKFLGDNGIEVPEYNAPHLDPIFVTGNRGVSNDGFKALVMTR